MSALVFTLPADKRANIINRQEGTKRGRKEGSRNESERGRRRSLFFGEKRKCLHKHCACTKKHARKNAGQKKSKKQYVTKKRY